MKSLENQNSASRYSKCEGTEDEGEEGMMDGDCE